ncbi:MAG: hypothetical protein K8I30_01150, partial [Anaerolineae bacterium]|nr:hypothetical protein [Anaerolineae bacterium]
MKRKTLILVLCLCIAAFSAAYVAAADLSQEYVSEDGTFSFRYPETYVLGGDMETGINLTADWGIALIYKTGYE